MTDFHTIRLLGPWQAEFFTSAPADGSTDTPNDRRRVKVPLLDEDWIAQTFSGEVRLNRSFNWPHEVEHNQTFLIEIDSNIDWRLSLNSRSFESTTPNLATLIQPTNRLALQASITSNADTPIINEVRLLVR